MNTTAGTYWVAAISLQPAPSFYGNGTVFIMSFRAPDHLVTTHINFTYSNLLDSDASQISHVNVDYEMIITSDTIARLDPASLIFGPRPCIGKTFV